MALVPLAAGPEPVILAMLFAAEFGSGFGVMMLDISIGAIFAAVIPDQLRSRVSGAFQAVNYGTRPLGAVAGGTLGSLIGIRPTLWIAAVGGMTGILWLLPSPLPRFRMPDGAADGASLPSVPAAPAQPAATGGAGNSAARSAASSEQVPGQPAR